MQTNLAAPIADVPGHGPQPEVREIFVSRSRGCRRHAWASWLVLGLAIAAPGAAQSQVDGALAFFQGGGAYCFRLAPEGVALSEEREWTVMVLTSAPNPRNVFRIREVDPGSTLLRGPALAAAGTSVTGVWRSDRARAEFFERFAAGIEAGTLRARVVQLHPATLDRLNSDRERADLYLKFSGRGSRVAFDSVPDLKADELAQYSTYFPD